MPLIPPSIYATSCSSHHILRHGLIFGRARQTHRQFPGKHICSCHALLQACLRQSRYCAGCTDASAWAHSLQCRSQALFRTATCPPQSAQATTLSRSCSRLGPEHLSPAQVGRSSKLKRCKASSIAAMACNTGRTASLVDPMQLEPPTASSSQPADHQGLTVTSGQGWLAPRRSSANGHRT